MRKSAMNIHAAALAESDIYGLIRPIERQSAIMIAVATAICDFIAANVK